MLFVNLFVSKVPYISYRVEPMETCERKEEKNFINKYANNVIKQKRRERKKKKNGAVAMTMAFVFMDPELL